MVALISQPNQSIVETFKEQIPEAELLDIGIREFDAGIPAEIADDEESNIDENFHA